MVNNSENKKIDKTLSNTGKKADQNIQYKEINKKKLKQNEDIDETGTNELSKYLIEQIFEVKKKAVDYEIVKIILKKFKYFLMEIAFIVV